MDITYTTPRAFVITAGAILAPCPPEPPTECSVPGAMSATSWSGPRRKGAG